MNFTQFSIRNPLVIAAITLALVCFGAYSYLTLGVSIVPNVSFPQVIVTTVVPGANPDSVETQVSMPIEDAVSTLQNVDTVTSNSTQGLSQVSIQFSTAANTDLVAVDVERAVTSVRSKLSPSAEASSILKVDTNTAFPVITVALSGSQPLDQVARVAADQVKRAMEVVPGVGSVTLSGDPVREIWVKADLDALQTRGLGLSSLQLALQNAQLQQPAGLLASGGKDATVVLDALVTDPRQLGSIVVAQTASGPVYVSDVATIDDTHARTTSIARVNGVPAVTLTATKLANANTIQVSQGIQQTLAQLQSTVPQGMQLQVVTDAATYTQQSFSTIQRTLVEAILLTGVILLLFLHTWRSTLIVMISIPTSVLMTFGLMNVLGLNLNLFSMLAITLAVGILVDDSIVVIENISRHLGLHQPPFVAAVRGRNEIGMAALTITMVDVVVYVPITFIPGIAGGFIRPFAVVIAAATLTSLVVSFTLTPLLASRYLTLGDAVKSGNAPLLRFGRWWDGWFERLEGAYRSLLHGVLHRRWLRQRVGMRWAVIAVGLASLAGGLGLLGTGRVGVNIFPSGDQSEVDITLTMPSASTIDTTDAVVKQLEQRLTAYPEVRAVYSSVGGGSGAGGDSAQIFALLVPTTDRQRSSTALADVLRQELGNGIPGATIRTGVPNAFGFGGSAQAIQIAVAGPNPDVLNTLVDQVTNVVQSTPGAVNVNNGNQNVMAQYTVSVDRGRAADLGVTSQAAAASLSAAVDGVKVGRFQRAGQAGVDIRLIAGDQFRASPQNLAGLSLLTSNGTNVSLGQIGTVNLTTSATTIAHYNRVRSVTINASNADGFSAGTLQSTIQARVGQVVLPPGYSISFGGVTQQGAAAFTNIFAALGVSILLMYMLMMLLFRSVTLPLAVLMSLPLAVIGALGAMTLTSSDFTLFSLLGLTLLVGLVGKNAILLVDYTDTLRKRGLGRTEALLEAAPTRLRPILMTTLSIMVALLPIALGIEPGSELLRSAAIVLIGGLTTSTLLTLVFVPAMYTIFDDAEAAVVQTVHHIARPRPLEPEELAILHTVDVPKAA